MAYLLNGGVTDGTQAWYQTINTDTYPKFTGETVYADCDHAKAFSNTAPTEEFKYENGFCNICGDYEPAVDSDSDTYYEIDNAGKLFWFAQQVNAGNTGYNAILTADIDLEGRNWTPIGNGIAAYSGTFDGGNHTVKNLSAAATESYAGMFGNVSGTVKNLSAYGNLTVTENSVAHIGVIGHLSGTAEGLNSYVDITVNEGVTGTAYIGGVVGQLNGGSVTKSAYYGSIDLGAASVDQAGGIVGYVAYTNTCSITNCGFYGTITTTNTSNSVGGILGYSRNSSLTLTNCLSVGDLPDSGSCVTAFGTLNSAPSAISALYYLEGSAPNAFANSGSYSYTPADGTITAVSKDQLTSGEIAWLLNGSSADNPVWKQTIGVDGYPVFTGETVYFDQTTNTYYNDAVTVLITWTAMEFTYDAGQWNPETHTYSGGTWQAVDGGGTVTVENAGGRGVTISFGFTPEMDGVSGSFDKPGAHLKMGESATSTLTLSGTPGETGFTDAVIGTATVTVTAGDTALGDAPGCVSGEAVFYEWSDDLSTCTAYGICIYCGGKANAETVDTKLDVLVAATCVAEGTGKYTATFTNSLYEAQSKETAIPIDPNAHDWQNDVCTRCQIGRITVNTVTATGISGWDSESNPDGTLETIGTPDPGKIAWESGDVLNITLNSEKFGTQTATAVYNGTDWTLEGSLQYHPDETPAVSASYGQASYLAEGFVLTGSVSDAELQFAVAERDYSRLRIVGKTDSTYTVTITNFSPAGGGAAQSSYTLTPDDKGNVFLYGSWSANSKITVKSGNTTVAEHDLAASANGQSYALNAVPLVEFVIDESTNSATLSSIPESATDEHIKAAIDALMGAETLVQTITVTPTVSDDVATYLDTKIKQVYGADGNTTSVKTTVNGQVMNYIADAAGLIAWKDTNYNTNVTLLKNIDMSGQTWVPDTTKYTSTFDGNGKKIQNLTISSSTSYAALIARLTTGTVKNLTFSGNHSVTCTATNISQYEALAVGCISGSGTVSNVSVESGNITVSCNSGKMYFGGVVGYASSGDFLIKNCTNQANITITYNGNATVVNAGGVVGGTARNNSARVLQCINTGKVVPPTVFTISGGGTSGAGEALPPAITGRGMALPSLLVLSLPSGAGMVLVIVMLGS